MSREIKKQDAEIAKLELMESLEFTYNELISLKEIQSQLKSQKIALALVSNNDIAE